MNTIQEFYCLTSVLGLQSFEKKDKVNILLTSRSASAAFSSTFSASSSSNFLCLAMSSERVRPSVNIRKIDEMVIGGKDLVKLGLEILYLFLAEKMVVFLKPFFKGKNFAVK